MLSIDVGSSSLWVFILIMWFIWRHWFSLNVIFWRKKNNFLDFMTFLIHFVNWFIRNLRNWSSGFHCISYCKWNEKFFPSFQVKWLFQFYRNLWALLPDSAFLKKPYLVMNYFLLSNFWWKYDKNLFLGSEVSHVNFTKWTQSC